MLDLQTGENLARGLYPGAATSDERNLAIGSLDCTHRLYPSDTELIRYGRSDYFAFIMEKGWAFSHRSLKSGSRQVTSIYVAGDLIGFSRGSRAERHPADASVCTVGAARVAEVEPDLLKRTLANQPTLAQAILQNEARVSAILQERLICLGRRSARSRIGHFYLELSVRVSNADIGFTNRFACPLSQYVVSDALGLSAEHLNRVLRQLRLARLLQVRNGHVEILDRHRLGELSDFDPGYLSLK